MEYVNRETLGIHWKFFWASMSKNTDKMLFSVFIFTIYTKWLGEISLGESFLTLATRGALF